MDIQLIRHATLQLEISGKRLLVDPMLSPAGEMDPAANASNQKRNPLCELPFGLPVIEQMDAVLVTHTHRDHFDAMAADRLPKHIPLFCQPEDQVTFNRCGFTRVIPVNDQVSWEGIQLIRTKARHGRGEMEEKMGPVSGFVLKTEYEPTLYLTGDTVWCPEVEQVLEKEEPDVAIVFAGAAQFLTGGAITMSKEDIVKVCQAGPNTKVMAVHMEAWNHCLLTRQELRTYLEKHNLTSQVLIPEDGERVTFHQTII
ncbi:MAG TPA: MBL fold metallo-hydrolase [Sporolactobacillaceae bacterium]|nr:MBL fold metallo-hydrolase [Sporolactobacillaceae bacterium]